MSLSGNSFVSTYNRNINTVYNTVGTQYKTDPTNSTIVSDASITVSSNPLSTLPLYSPTTDYGTLSINAQGIVLGNKTSVVSVPGSLVITYIDVAGVGHTVTLGKFLSQTTRTRL